MLTGLTAGMCFTFLEEMASIGLHSNTRGYVSCNEDGFVTSLILPLEKVLASGSSSDWLAFTCDNWKQHYWRIHHLKKNVKRNKTVRVISYIGGRYNPNPRYIYEGLYQAESFAGGKPLSILCTFHLRRIPHPSHVEYDYIRAPFPFSLMPSSRTGIVCEDLSLGQEKFPVCCVNTVDNAPEKPPFFTYSKEMSFSESLLILQKKPTIHGCCHVLDCLQESVMCSCAGLNGGNFPYFEKEILATQKNILFECGTLCQCSCSNRVAQKGIKYRFEVFKTLENGWGLRSLDFIPLGLASAS